MLSTRSFRRSFGSLVDKNLLSLEVLPDSRFEISPLRKIDLYSEDLAESSLNTSELKEA